MKTPSDPRDQKNWKWDGEPVTWWEFCERLTGLDVRKGPVVLGDDGYYHYASEKPESDPNG